MSGKKKKLKRVYLNKLFDVMINDPKSDLRQEAYIFLIKELKKGTVEEEGINELILREINRKNYCTNIVYITCNFTKLSKHIYIASEDRCMQYIEEKGFEVKRKAIREQIRLYLLRFIRSTEVRDYIGSFICDNGRE
jgi:hypothetical protein